MRITGYLNPSELALWLYLILTGMLILLRHSVLPHAHFQLAIRAGVILVTGLLAWMQHRGNFTKALPAIRFILPLLLLTYLYKETDTLNNTFFSHDLDPFFSGIEQSLFGLQPALAFAVNIPSDLFAELMYFGYFSYYLMLAAVPIYIYFTRDPAIASRTMFIIIHSFFLFYILFILFPVGGPQFYFTDWPVLPQGYFFGTVMRFIQENGEAPTAAFPSSHVSICFMLIALSYRYAKVLLKFIIPVAVLLVLSTVYIRAHYIIDIIGAILITPVFYLFSNFIFDKIYKKP